MDYEAEIKKLEADVERYRSTGREKDAGRKEEKVVLLQRKWDKEKKVVKPHPALQFGVLWQTAAIMAALSLAMSVVPLPCEARPFYIPFSRITILAVTCLVVHASIIYYGYKQALAKLPKSEEEDLESRLKKMRKGKPDRADLWAHTRSHPSLFLTTRHAPPRLFPFPLGKTRPDATVKDELWWEGGNAPHVGHFNKPKLPEPPAPDEETLMSRFKASKELEDQQKLWKKRIRTIQYLCVVIILSFVSRGIAVAALCWLVYNTVSTELDNMLKPPLDMEPVYKVIDSLTRGARNESTPKARGGQPSSGMSYIYDPTSAKTLRSNANIPLHFVSAPVLMTSENKWLAGPGEPIKKEE